MTADQRMWVRAKEDLVRAVMDLGFPEELGNEIAKNLGNINGACDGCMAGLAEMYQDYIDGKKEIREINMAFRAQYESGEDGPIKKSCGYY